MDSQIWSMSRAPQLKSIVNFKMFLHPMQCDNIDAEKDVRVNKKNPQSQNKCKSFGQNSGITKINGNTPTPVHSARISPFAYRQVSGYAIIWISITLGFTF